MNADDVEVNCERDRLMIRGHKRQQETREEEGFFRTERSFGSFERMIPIPESVDVDNAEATFEDGILTVEIPKAEGAERRHKLDIKSK